MLGTKINCRSNEQKRLSLLSFIRSWRHFNNLSKPLRRTKRKGKSFSIGNDFKEPDEVVLYGKKAMQSLESRGLARGRSK
jgi:hypothetical protein